jgi:hypothetical protein
VLLLASRDAFAFAFAAPSRPFRVIVALRAPVATEPDAEAIGRPIV